MNFAIVDIETTGGYADGNGITEISVQVYDGQKVVQQYETLINPQQPIPYYIRGLTGINDSMVANAPTFEEVAGDIFKVLDGCIFVAHSVNFDYSFIRHALLKCGYNLNLKKLCTVRLSRQIIPGLPSYSLGKICAYLDIEIENRHRAGGDAEATVKLFKILQQRDSGNIIDKFLKRNSKEQALPPNLPRAQFEKLPHTPGVYYFHNQKGKIVYVGKAVDIKKRVTSHFSNNKTNKQKQDFLRTIHAVSCEECGSELMALILESAQIKHYWPEHNRAQKRFEPVFGIMEYHDQRGFRRLVLDKMRKGARPLAAFSNLNDGFNTLKKTIDDFALCPRLAGIATDATACEQNKCACIKGHKAQVAVYNRKVAAAVSAFGNNESFLIVEKGRSDEEVGLVVIEQGSFKRMGYLAQKDFNRESPGPGALEALPLFRDNFNIRQIINSYVFSNPQNVVGLGMGV